MRLKDTIKTAVQALGVNKGRSALTVLGVVIGVSAIMIIMSVGNSAEQLIRSEIQSFGPQNVFINPGKPSEGLLGASMAGMLSDKLTIQDIEDLKKKSNVPDAIIVNPSVSGSMSVAYESETEMATVIGSGSEGFDIYNLSVSYGRKFTDEEVNEKAAVVVLGKNIAKDLLGSDFKNPEDLVGEKIKIKEKKFKVIGIFSTLGSAMFGIDDMIIAPYTTMQEYVLGIRHFHEIVVQARSVDDIKTLVLDIKHTLRENHNIDDPEKDDFIVSTQEDIIESVDQILSAVTVFLALVAAISLLVGGIGVMNIMFVSVTERTREIGLRKALGATNKNILLQFLLEAVFLTGGGGVFGIIVGASISFLITVGASYFTNIDFPYIFSGLGVFLGVLVACGAGLFFGIFPANNASKKSPMEALRYE